MLNKNEFKLILIILAISAGLFIFYSFIFKQSSLVEVTHKNTVVKKIDSSKDGKYEIQGTYGKLSVEVKDSKVRVTEEECPNHVCSTMGWISKESFVPILCLPNEVMINFKESSNE